MAGGIPAPWHCQPHGAAEPPLHPAAPTPCVPVLRAEPDHQLPPPGLAVAAGLEKRRMEQGRAWPAPLAAREGTPTLQCCSSQPLLLC